MSEKLANNETSGGGGAIEYPQDLERFFPVAELDKAKLREQAALEQARRARESTGAMAEQLQSATKQNSELNLQLTIMTNDAIEWEGKAEEAEARLAELLKPMTADE